MPATEASTRSRLVEATLAVLRDDGFAAATSRAIAARAGVNQGLVFYYFGSLDALLLAALDATSEDRMRRYRQAAEDASTPADLVDLLRTIYREDTASGHVTVVAQMVAGSVARPELAAEVLRRMEPWLDFAEDSIRKVLVGTPLADVVPPRELATAVVTFYLGANLLTHLGAERQSIDALFDRVFALAPLLS